MNDCPDCAKLNGGLCQIHIAQLLQDAGDRECNIEVTDAEVGKSGRLLQRFVDEAGKAGF